MYSIRKVDCEFFKDLHVANKGTMKKKERRKKEFVENARNSSGLSYYIEEWLEFRESSFLASSRANLPSLQIFETSTRSKHLYGYAIPSAT